MELFYVPTADNVADDFNKALCPETFTRLAHMTLASRPNKKLVDLLPFKGGNLYRPVGVYGDGKFDRL